MSDQQNKGLTAEQRAELRSWATPIGDEMDTEVMCAVRAALAEIDAQAKRIQQLEADMVHQINEGVKAVGYMRAERDTARAERDALKAERDVFQAAMRENMNWREDALKECEKLRAEMRAALSTVTYLQAKRGEAEAERDALRAENEKLSNKAVFWECREDETSANLTRVVEQRDALKAENEKLRHDIARHVAIATEYANDADTLRALVAEMAIPLEALRVTECDQDGRALASSVKAAIISATDKARAALAKEKK